MAFRPTKASLSLAGLLAVALLGGLGACTAPGGQYDKMMAEREVVGATRDSFTICHGHACRLRSRLGLTELEWDPVADLFAEPAASAAIERGRIATAIGIIEAAVGPKAGTSNDRGGTFNALSGNDQFDCVDETTNTSVYLTLLAKAGYLKWHKLEGWAGRGVLFDGAWPHQSAVIVELKSDEPYAVDSWFEDNGRAAHVVPLADWRAGWSPPGFSDNLL
ncbi:hypothetical protein [Pelagibius marinus]|uniref:hypothetical protein n=1 Tax=Pelagibius marinus TaxID=2762760 RepID=UPI001872B9D9|nr:hypothetical protein [Pelagibius marinus]